MGKSLIIKGADFSQNAIEFTTNWYYHVFSDKIQEGEGWFTNARMDRAGWTFSEVNEAITGKTVNVIKVQPVIAGRFNFYIVNSSELETLTTPLSNPCAFIDIKERDIGVLTDYVLSSPISIKEGEALVIGEYDETRTSATMAFYNYSGTLDFWFLIGTTGVTHTVSHHHTQYAPFDIGLRVFQ